MNPRIFYIIYALYCFFLHLLIYCYYNYTKPPLPIIKELKTMQKQSFQRFPIRYRPYDFPSRFPVLAFLGDNWTISVNSPEYLHFHNGLEIGHCISGNGQLFLAGQAPVPYEAEAFSILFPQVPHWRYAACRKAAGNIFILIQSIFWNPHRTVVRIPGRFFICFRRFP